MLFQENATKQGTVGLSIAIAFFSARGWTVSLPLVDGQPYDLIVDEYGSLKKVQVKTSRHLRQGSYKVALESSYRTAEGSIRKPIDLNSFDYLFVLAGDGNVYLIPSECVGGRKAIRLGEKYSEYIMMNVSGFWKDKGNDRLSRTRRIDHMYTLGVT